MMETWFFIIILCFCLSIILKTVANLLFPGSPLPPGPSRFNIIGNIKLSQQYIKDPETLLKNLHAKYGPIFSVPVGSHIDIFIGDRFLAHQALIENSIIFADRPEAIPTNKILSYNQRDIVFSVYGPRWRLLRRNLTSRTLHSSQVKSYARTRKWVLDMLLERFKSDVDARNYTIATEYFRYGMFCLQVLLCLGDKLDEKQIKEIEETQCRMIVSFERYFVLNLWPPITTILFRKRMKEFLQLRKDQEDVLIPLINARRKIKEERQSNVDRENSGSEEYVECYVDTLLDLELSEEDEGSKLDDANICTLCAEFVNAGAETTATALEWIMANVVKYQDIQKRIVEEIKGVMGDREEKEVKYDDLHKLPYLKAVVLEGLRRHPPAHYVPPHKVTKDFVLNGYLIPTSATINFLVAEMAWDPTNWDDPMAFKPERFMNNGEENGGKTFDITGSKEIKMMPFGVGRRMCPGYAVGMMHLEYFVANFVWKFEWKVADGDDIDMSEKLQFTSVMKNPFKAHISPRF
ncbi:hypothetical protein RIF29_32685 [Crotalaria pallida]|uniref:Cytochrome P450 n=1 Tax=Crotalaria pallida TaxID=3830 RepID=A0AAN9EIJ1_CROPI